jgi:hypothetical protein
MLILHTLLMGVECARLLREHGTGETPQARSAEEARPRGAARMERKSTDKFNTALFINKNPLFRGFFTILLLILGFLDRSLKVV